MTAIANERRRLERFIERLKGLNAEQWRKIIDARPSDEGCALAAHSVDIAKEVSGRGPARELRELLPRVYAAIEHLVSQEPVVSIARDISPSHSTVLLAHVAKGGECSDRSDHGRV